MNIIFSILPKLFSYQNQQYLYRNTNDRHFSTYLNVNHVYLGSILASFPAIHTMIHPDIPGIIT